MESIPNTPSYDDHLDPLRAAPARDDELAEYQRRIEAASWADGSLDRIIDELYTISERLPITELLDLATARVEAAEADFAARHMEVLGG